MKTGNATIKIRWLVIILFIGLLSVGGFYLLNQRNAVGPGGVADQGAGNATSLITIQPASVITGTVSASGNIALIERHNVALAIDGVVEEIAVQVGDVVTAGTPLLALATTPLERALMRAQLAVDTQQSVLAQYTEERSAAEIGAAEADLAQAQENLSDALAGATAEELAAARSNLAAAWSSYNEVQEDPTADELAQLNADMRKAEVAMAEAQRNFDQVAWVNTPGMTEESARLQETTIDYEKARAAYNETVAPAAQSEVQTALSAAQDAQVQLDDLLNSPTNAEVAAAQATVANAESRVADLAAGSSSVSRRDAELSLDQALLDLQEAYSDLAAAQPAAPVDGVVLELNAEIGEFLSENAIVAVLADTSQLELTVNVAEVDIMQVGLGQPVEITVDALVGRRFQGVIEQITPISAAGEVVVNYPVTIRLLDIEQNEVLAGMTAVATLIDTETVNADLWLVPVNGIESQDSASVVTVVRGEETLTIPVEPQGARNDWQVVQSAGLQIGDQVEGSVASFVDDANPFGEAGGAGGE